VAVVGLDDPRWAQLSHAYGAADDVPHWLAAIRYPGGSDHDQHNEGEPWHELWSSLCHQGDVYSASFAAVPHIVDVISQHPERATWEFFALPVCIEIERRRAGIDVPEDMEPEYSQALQHMGQCAARFASGHQDQTMSVCLLAAIALAHGNFGIARMLIEIPPSEADEAVELFMSR
jgi:hypothetical protein